MLPPPTTIATWTPLRTTSATCRAIDETVEGSMPRLAAPANASPDSFRSTRFHCGGVTSNGGPPSASGFVFRLAHVRDAHVGKGLGAYFEAGETLEGHARLLDDLLDGLLVVADVGLVDENDVLEETV